MAYSNNGAQCVDASDNLANCGLAIDGDAATEWTYSGAGEGMWLKIQFDRQYLINTLRIKQKANANEQNKGLKLTFMDGSEAFVSNSSFTYCNVVDCDTFNVLITFYNLSTWEGIFKYLSTH